MALDLTPSAPPASPPTRLVQGIEVSFNGSKVLKVFHELYKVVARTPQPFAKPLLEICAKQHVSHDCWPRKTVPVCMLLDVVLRRKYSFDEDDTVAISALSSKTLSWADAYPNHGRCVLISASVTLAFIAGRTGNITSAVDVPKLIKMFAAYVDKVGERDMLYALRAYYRDPNYWSTHNPPFISPAELQAPLPITHPSTPCLSIPRVFMISLASPAASAQSVTTLKSTPRIR